MGLKNEIEKLKLDKRLIDWHVAHGKLSREDLKNHLANLPDLASNVEPFSLGDDYGDSMPRPADESGYNGNGGY